MLRNSLENPQPGPSNDDLSPGPVVVPDNALTRQYDAISGRQATVSLPAARVVRGPLVVDDPTLKRLKGEDAEDPFDDDQRQYFLSPTSPTQPPKGFKGIDILGDGFVVGLNEERFLMTPEERQKALQFCFEVAQRATLAGLESLRQDLGLDEQAPA